MKQTTEPITAVAFRMWDGEVVAIMPQIPGTNAHDCTCYAHVGQHGACDPVLAVQRSRPATAAEYRGLARELEHIGYRVRVIKRLNLRKYLDARRAEVRRIESPA